MKIEKENLLQCLILKVYGLNDCKDCKLDKNMEVVLQIIIWSKDLNRLPDMYCYWQQILLDEAIRICNVLGMKRMNCLKTLILRLEKNNE